VEIRFVSMIADVDPKANRHSGAEVETEVAV
jgi:hypothetical protein